MDHVPLLDVDLTTCNLSYNTNANEYHTSSFSTSSTIAYHYGSDHSVPCTDIYDALSLFVYRLPNIVPHFDDSSPDFDQGSRTRDFFSALSQYLCESAVPILFIETLCAKLVEANFSTSILAEGSLHVRLFSERKCFAATPIFGSTYGISDIFPDHELDESSSLPMLSSPQRVDEPHTPVPTDRVSTPSLPVLSKDDGLTIPASLPSQLTNTIEQGGIRSSTTHDPLSMRKIRPKVSVTPVTVPPGFEKSYRRSRRAIEWRAKRTVSVLTIPEKYKGCKYKYECMMRDNAGAQRFFIEKFGKPFRIACTNCGSFTTRSAPPDKQADIVLGSIGNV